MLVPARIAAASPTRLNFHLDCMNVSPFLRARNNRKPGDRGDARPSRMPNCD
jgi:hypothetical protein